MGIQSALHLFVPSGLDISQRAFVKRDKQQVDETRTIIGSQGDSPCSQLGNAIVHADLQKKW